MPLTLDDRKKGNKASCESNKLKGLIKFVTVKTSYKDVLHNKLITQLIESGLYEKYYNKYILNSSDSDSESDDVNRIANMPDKVYNIFKMFNTCQPSELKNHYKNYITENTLIS